VIDLTKVNWPKVGEAVVNMIDSDELCEVMEEELEEQGVDSDVLLGYEGDDFDILEKEIGKKITAAFKK